jgi:hypothetical protein
LHLRNNSTHHGRHDPAFTMANRKDKDQPSDRYEAREWARQDAAEGASPPENLSDWLPTARREYTAAYIQARQHEGERFALFA